MIVVNTQPFALIYGLFQHPYLGVLLEPHVVQVNSKGAYTLTHQRVFSKTADYFEKGISSEDYELIKVLDELDDDFIFKRFYKDPKKKIRTAEFFSKHCSKELLEDKIRPFIEERMNKVLLRLRGRTIYKNGNDNNPTSVKILVGEEQANIWFHFKNNPEGIRYYPTLRYKNQKVEFMYKGAQIISLAPAWLLLDNQLFDFEKNVDGKKLVPFMSKRFIQIPKKTEETYLNKFVLQLVEKYDVKSDCFKINHLPSFGYPVLNMQALFEDEVALRLQFNYANISFDYGSDQDVHAQLIKQESDYVFNRVARNRKWEEGRAKFIEGLGLKHARGAFFVLPNQEVAAPKLGILGTGSMNKYAFLDWLNQHFETLKQHGIELNQDSEHNKFYIGHRELKIEVNEQKDWFDVRAIVQFGEFTFSFLALREYIIKGKREFILPNGLIAIIPEEWFGNLTGIFEFSTSEDEIKIEKHHIGLLEDISQGGGRYVKMSDKLKSLIEYGALRDMELPQFFKGTLRPYQKAGFDWFYFLKDNQFGGCLADDMGLGKTIQTLALIQKEKELYLAQPNVVKADQNLDFSPFEMAEPKAHGSAVQLSIFDQNPLVQTEQHTVLSKKDKPASNAEVYLQTGGILHHSLTPQGKDNTASNNYIRTSLIVVPNSLIYNWYNEAKKFTPGLKVLIYTGINRAKSTKLFTKYDLVISTYGTVRVDIDILKEFVFNYIILDESQAIKNANSQVSKAVKVLKSMRKLVLTGTPIENSVQELWSQLSFVNPGLLGSLSSFQDRFVSPIEKQKDLQKMRQLKAIINPFILRRTKDQVATDLPAKMEQVVYCEMSEEQAEAYEKVKSHYRNEILKVIKDMGIAKSQFTLLQGLTKLRQIANHPLLVNPEFVGDSGKFVEVTEMAQTAMAEGHKVLIFSQFVSQLAIYKNWFDTQKIAYCYLDGSMSSEARQLAVQQFQEGDFPFFLISLKAGGFGLNLTKADYVFMIDPWWNPAIERQAIDRAHRIGQTQNVFIYKFISKDTVEEKILALQEKKKLLADSMIETDESIFKQIDVDEILELLN
ncbi:MAG: DEAD/DEAH box helicase [Sphingobacteriales bacterium]|nr:DEAD/DEAH box helicase [Sphingobacteriales bacterium]